MWNVLELLAPFALGIILAWLSSAVVLLKSKVSDLKETISKQQQEIEKIKGFLIL